METSITPLTSYSDYNDLDAKKTPVNFDFDDIPLGEGDDESFSEYGEEQTRFNEDGSFIGVYADDTKKPPQHLTSTESLV